MSRLEFMKKYPELVKDGEISMTKMSVILKIPSAKSSGFTTYTSASVIAEDYNAMILTENRDNKINSIL